MKSFTLKGWKALLGFVGLFLGFSTAVTAQYGVVENYWQLQGQLIDESCETPVTNMKIRIDMQNPSQEWSYPLMNERVGMGRFVVNLYDVHQDNDLTIALTSLDTAVAGPWKDTVFVVHVKDLNFKPADEHRGWHNAYRNDPPLFLKAKSIGPPPCVITEAIDTIVAVVPTPENPDPLTTEPPDQIPAIVENTAIILMDTTEIEPVATIGGELDNAMILLDQLGPDASLLVYPNPAVHLVNVKVDWDVDEEVAISLYNMRGRLVFRGKLKFMEGTNRAVLDISALAPAEYILAIEGNQNRKTTRLVKSAG